MIVRGLLDALDEFVAIRREGYALATRNSSQPGQRLAAGRKLVERVARLKLTADGPNGLSLGRLMKDSSLEDVLDSLRTAAEFDQADQARRADNQLQSILGIVPELDGLRIDPCIPRSWPGFQVERQFRGKKLSISVENPKGLSKGVQRLQVDGKVIAGNLLPLSLLRDGLRVQAVLEG